MVRRGVVQTEGLLIEGHISGGNPGQQRLLKGQGGEGNVTGGRQDIAEAFVVGEEEELVLDDRTSAVHCPLVGDCLGTSDARLLAEPIIRIENAAVVPVVSRSVELVAA